MWDQLFPYLPPVSPARIIPTYVGSTRATHTLNAVNPNHSHVCGINFTKPLPQSERNESFPRMWDQQILFTLDSLNFRIIPTYVGSTNRHCYFGNFSTNHSHVCGINFHFGFCYKLGFESFPRMWDQLPFSIPYDIYLRIIPTYVGSTYSRGRVGDVLANHSHVCGINVVD